MKKFPHYRQLDTMDCGPTCIRMIGKHYGKHFSLQALRRHSYLTREGVSMLGIAEASEAIGMRTMAVKISFTQLAQEGILPCIIPWNQNHFVVLYRITRHKVYIADPAQGLLSYSLADFKRSWLAGSLSERGLVLFLSPMPAFYEEEGEEKSDKVSFAFLWHYLRSQRQWLGQLILSFLIGSILLLLAPFLTQSVVDVGIRAQDLSLLLIILIGQLFLLLSQTTVSFIRQWILLHFSTRLNIELISDFLIKLTRLPMHFFDSKMTGDILQRIGDHARIQQFLGVGTLNTLFSLFNLLVFSVVMWIYSPLIWAVFVLGSTLYIVWIVLFLRQRYRLDYKRFQQLSGNQSNLIQLVQGMQEIKLTSSEQIRRWEWERIQAKIFKINLASLRLEQWQSAGGTLINEGKNILITYLAASAVINGDMTLGMMLAIQYILGQLNAPINQMIGFLHSYQDAKISLERLNEIRHTKDEDANLSNLSGLQNLRGLEGNITIKNLTFQYEGPSSPKVLDNISAEIPIGKVTAIVGMSGSGKTTLLKLLLKYYELKTGQIKVANTDLSMINSRLWRKHCGVVMQEGFIFSDTIARNIATSEEEANIERLEKAVQIANIQEFVRSLPLGWQSKIGMEGSGISTGQKQRILIARAIYKNPEFLFFDEATSALDANNERIIMQNLKAFYQGKTVIVIAHRLSTVRQADKILVLEQGKLVEEGTHEHLSHIKGKYYELVKNQLEL